jgi:hypothetical protein
MGDRSHSVGVPGRAYAVPALSGGMLRPIAAATARSSPTSCAN